MTRLSVNTTFALIPLIFLAGCEGGMEGTGLRYGLAAEPPTPTGTGLSRTCVIGFDDSPSSNISGFKIEPPIHLQGNWVGQRDNGEMINIVVTHDNIAFGTPSPQTFIDDEFGRRDVTEEESMNGIYRIVVGEQFDESRVVYTHEYSFIDNNQIQYTLISAGEYLNESITMSPQAPTDAIYPPPWLEGEWSDDSGCQTRNFVPGDIQIEYDNADSIISLAEIIAGDRATFQTKYVDETQYEIITTYFPPDSSQRLRIREIYVLNEDGSVDLFPGDDQIRTFSRK